jgi:hypothetical protein
MRRMLIAVTTALAAGIAGCGSGANTCAVAEVRGHLSSPKPRYYLMQTMGPGEELPGADRAMWYPARGADAGKRLVIRFGEDNRLEHAAVLSSGPAGAYDVTDEVIFDRAQWRTRAQTSRP